MPVKRVAVLGASNKKGNYSNRAVCMLKEHGYEVIPVHPTLDDVEGLAVVHDLCGLKDPVDTLTVYVGPERSEKLADEIVAMRPGRVILNPGAECAALEKRLCDSGIPVVKACTLVLLRTGRFEAR